MASNLPQNRMKEINLILLGKSGDGKSSTGNSILGRAVFPTSIRMEPKTSICTLECSKKGNNLIRVIDTPGFLNTRNPTKSILPLISQALSLCPGGVDAYILVIRFGNNFTSKDIHCLNSLKTHLGENFIRDSGIIVLTNCDYFEASREHESPTMKDWIDQSIRHGKDAPFVQLLEMFNYRYVQFYNTGDPYSKKREQGVAKLFEMINAKFFSPVISRSINAKESMSVSQNKVMNIVLLGKTGNGKSATGNTILGWPAFLSSGITTSETKLAVLQCAEVDSTLIRVVDTPGLIDTEDPAETTLSQISQAMSFCPEGFNALVLVLKYGSRFTEEEKRCLEILKQNFGVNFLKDHGVVVMTNGESFDTEYEGTDMTYKDWLKLGHDEQFAKLVVECDNRVILMCNKGKSYVDKRKQSRDELLRMIREEVLIPYRSEHFQLATRIRETIEQFQGPLFNRHIQENLSLLICQMETDIQNNTLSYEDTIASFEKLYKAVSEFSFATGRKSLKEKLETIQKRFQELISVTDRATQKREQLKIINDVNALKDTPDSANCWQLKTFNTCAGMFMKMVDKLTVNEMKYNFNKRIDEWQKRLKEFYQKKMMQGIYNVIDFTQPLCNLSIENR